MFRNHVCGHLFVLMVCFVGSSLQSQGLVLQPAKPRGPAETYAFPLNFKNDINGKAGQGLRIPKGLPTEGFDPRFKIGADLSPEPLNLPHWRNSKDQATKPPPAQVVDGSNQPETTMPPISTYALYLLTFSK